MRPFLIVCALLFSFSISMAQSAFDKEAFLSEGADRTIEELHALGKELLPQDQSCPQGGTQILENLAHKQAGLLSAIQAIDSVVDAVKPHQQAKASEQNRCGKCRQNNVVSALASVSPDQIRIARECEGRPTETFRLNAKDKNEIKKFTEALLRGQNQEGRRLAAGCPDPCSYYVTTAQTKTHSGTHLALTIQCGQPRKGSIFSAAYNFKAGVVHQWTCSK